MKKSIAVILLGSALMLPNNNSAEAANVDNNVRVQKAQYVQCIKWEGNQDWLSYSQQIKRFNNLSQYFYNNYFVKDREDKPEHVKPETPKPEVTPEQPKPEPSTPEVKPEQPKPEPSTPEVKPEQPKPEPSTPEVKPEQPKPEPSTPEVKPEQPKPDETTQDASISAIEKAVLDLTNVERQKAGLAPLQIDSKLMNSARQKSSDMASKNYFSHTSPTYGSPFDQMKANGITYRSAAENIAQGQRSAEEVVKAWMESPGHRENILTPGFTHIGIGYDKDGNYWTQQFIQKR
ncbi:CAP domain-containing protein [Filibacter tadaridae]|uniref:Cysteine-rich secretory protein family protein n=2 Tax=Filibacter tadaridae TaxID=2483811 RepID=A0A3P5X3Y4_9BACL|nr:CAP domain-containing protein [Filibacter tadaridae]VDC28990.1 Cysteine-rich secretory protein family protein [Filibacter tadaridae]